MEHEELKLLLGNVTAIRTQFRANPRLQLEFKATISKLLREHNIDISDNALSSITLAVYPELSSVNISVGEPLPVPDLGPLPTE